MTHTRVAPAVAVLLLWSCGEGGRRLAAFQPEGGCHEGIWVEDEERDCGCLRACLHASKDLLQTQAGIAPAWFEGVQVYVSARSGHIEEGTNVSGATWSADELVTERWMRPLSHELLHVYELRNGVGAWDTARHLGWEERGWNMLSELGFNQTERCW